ncbi:hypothetical protein RJ639_002498 [Escallonia herrerae]|uniref:Purple acid phosphatase C-terminal domain-containing protein n=1 Tax=Escallonia herrerae TaxID=1293975 RepID=A0AA88XIX4_9ASTE|nr:hypothetical protein RJ639_002498 [Escallonia herrerae]
MVQTSDMPYANGYISQWDQFASQVEPIASAVPSVIMTMFYVPAENRAKFWYSTDFGIFHFCIADTEHDWRKGSEQYKFIEKCLVSADRQKQPWLIFAAHRPLGYSSNEWYAQEGSFEEPMGREPAEALAEIQGGHCLLWARPQLRKILPYLPAKLTSLVGDLHARTHGFLCRPAKFLKNKCVNSATSHYSGTVNGTIHVVAGGGGSHLSAFSPVNAAWSLYKDYDFGFVKLTAFNHSSLLFECQKSRDGKVYDSFTISRAYRDVLACVHDGCEPTTLAS